MASPLRTFLLLTLFAGILFFFRLGDRDFTSSHEARAAQNAQTILSQGAWGLPRLFDGQIDLQKPPLFYWLVAIAGWLRGGVIDPWTLRLIPAFCALGTILLVFLLSLRLSNLRTGFFSAFILATSLHFTWLARVGRIDMPLTFALTLAITGFLLAHQKRKQGHSSFPWFLTAYLALAAGILLKGPLALILFLLWYAGLRFFGIRWMTPQQYPLTGCHSWRWGIPLVLALTLPWFLWANWQTDNRLWEVFFLYHNLRRGLGGEENLASHPLWYYLPRLAVDCFPWSLFLPWMLFRGCQSLKASSPERRPLPVLAQIGFLWFFLFLLFFSLMSFKRADYLLPAFPGFALALASLLDAALQKTGMAIQTVRRKNWLLVPGLACAAVLAWLVYLQWFDDESARGWALQKEGADLRSRSHMPVIFFRTEAHALAFHIGPKIGSILEWENLDIWACKTAPVYFVMPADCAAAWPKHLQKGKLVEVRRMKALDERPLVVLRNHLPE